MKIIFWGTRGSIAAPGKWTNLFGGNTTCLQVILKNGKHLIIDAGTGIRLLGNYLNKLDFQKDLVILMTHSHWDHIQGFPFFTPVYNPNQNIIIKGFASSFAILQEIFTNQMLTSYFPINFSDLKAHFKFEEMAFGADHVFDTTIEVIQNVHPGGSIGIKIKEDNKIFTFLTDCELIPVFNNNLMWADLVKFCKGSDLIVVDGQYLPSDLEKYKGWGHSTYIEASKLAIESDSKKLLLTHHDPRRNDRGVFELEIAAMEFIKNNKSSVNVKAAKEQVVYCIE